MKINLNKDYAVVSEDLVSYIYTRDEERCQITGGRGNEIHHIKPKSLGGKNCARNLVLLSKVGHMIQHGLIQGQKPFSQLLLKKVIMQNEKRLKGRII